MKRVLKVVFAGVAAGVLAHVGWFTAQRPARADTLEAQLAWMQTSLQLSPAQFARIKELHETSSPRLRALAADVGRMRHEFETFEQERQTAGQIDFLEFARFVEQRRAVDRECLASTQRLVQAASEVMTAPQREHYLALLDPALRGEGRGVVN